MYSPSHILFIFISLLIVFIGIFVCVKMKISTEKVIWICFLTGVICETVKIFDVIKLIPIVEPTIENGSLIYHSTGEFSPYIESKYVPYELCSFQIFFLFLAHIVKNEKWKRRIYSLIYATALIGGLLAIFLSGISNDFHSIKEHLLSIRGWEFYIFHAMIIVTSIAIARDKEYGPRFSDIKWTSIIILLFDIPSFYINSLFSVPLYSNGNLIGITYSVNHFTSYFNPLGINITTKFQYMIYIVIRFIVGFLCVFIVYTPFLRKKENKN